MAMQKLSMGAILAIAVSGVILSLLVSGLLMSSQKVPATGTVATVNIGVFRDEDCRDNQTSIDWGFLLPGETATKKVYIKNNGTAAVNLTMTIENWDPVEANGPITLFWDRAGETLGPSAVVEATLTLTVSSAIDENIAFFSFDIIITGTE